jgi:hypothetical protein
MGCAAGWVHCRAAEDELGLSDGSVDADDDWLAEVLLSHVASMPLPLPFPLPALVRAAAVALTLPSHSPSAHAPVLRAGVCRSVDQGNVPVSRHMMSVACPLPGFRVVPLLRESDAALKTPPPAVRRRQTRRQTTRARWC